MLDIGFISLGCAKNQVDTEIMMGLLKKAGHRIVNTLPRSELIIINTCAFIDAAKEEAIQQIIEIGGLKRGGGLRWLIVTGCLPQLHAQELLDELPELDAVVGVAHFTDIVSIVERVKAGQRICCSGVLPTTFIEKGPRLLSTPPGFAYLKIADGCDNRCTYCAIPTIRGRLRSRPVEELITEATELVKKDGVRELILIAQDTAHYGWDLFGYTLLPDLLAGLDGIAGLEWLRLMYLHPAHVDDSIIEAMQSCSKLLPYLDVPIQHAADPILQRMNRRHDQTALRQLLLRLRSALPGLVLRTTVMLGFPGETEEDFQALYDLVAEVEFDWLGAFSYSAQDSTPAAVMDLQVDPDLTQQRLEKILALQQEITKRKNLQRIGQRERVLVTSRVSRHLYAGRACFQAPEVDGLSLIKCRQAIKLGDMVEIHYEGLRDYDLIGELVE